MGNMTRAGRERDAESKRPARRVFRALIAAGMLLAAAAAFGLAAPRMAPRAADACGGPARAAGCAAEPRGAR